MLEASATSRLPGGVEEHFPSVGLVPCAHPKATLVGEHMPSAERRIWWGLPGARNLGLFREVLILLCTPGKA